MEKEKRPAAGGENGENEKIETLRAWLDGAESVIIGAGAGLSTAAGFTYGGEQTVRGVSAGKRGQKGAVSGAGRGHEHPGHHQVPLLADDLPQQKRAVRLHQSGDRVRAEGDF